MSAELMKGLFSPDESLVVIHLHERVTAVQQNIENASESPDVHLITVILTACARQAAKGRREGPLGNRILQTNYGRKWISCDESQSQDRIKHPPQR